MLVTDLGTEFGMVVVPGIAEDVYVLDGEVRVETLFGAKDRKVLEIGDAYRVNENGRLVQAPELTQPFVETLPNTLPYLHFAFDDVTDGRTSVGGDHPMLDNISAELVQSDGRPSVDRLVDGRFGKSLWFDGEGDVVFTNWPGVYGDQALTISLWVKLERSPGFAGLLGWGVSKKVSDGMGQWKLVVPPKKREGEMSAFRCSWGENSIRGTAINLDLDEWIHLGIVYTGEKVSFYKDGELLRSKPTSNARPPQRPQDLAEAFPLIFGDQMAQSKERDFLCGQLDDVYIIEGALSPEQLQQLYKGEGYRR